MDRLRFPCTGGGWSVPSPRGISALAIGTPELLSVDQNSFPLDWFGPGVETGRIGTDLILSQGESSDRTLGHIGQKLFLLFSSVSKQGLGVGRWIDGPKGGQ